jgi:hypothetical protein
MVSEAGYATEGLRQDAFVEKVTPDPTQPVQPMAVLEGLLGRSCWEGYWRLYLTDKLNGYLEFKEGDVLNSESIPKEQSKLGLESTRIWLRRDAEIVRVRSRRGRASDFMAEGGMLERGVARRAAAAGDIRKVQGPTT